MTAGKPREPAAPGADEDTLDSAAVHSAAGGAGEAGLSSLLRRSVKAAIARWAVRRRTAGEIWPRPQDEAPHPWDGQRRFAEEYTLVAVQAGLAIVARIEWLPGRETHRVWLTLLTPTAVYALPGTGQALLRGESDHWRAGGLAFDCVEPLRQWTVRYAGRLEVRDPAGHRRRPASDELPAEDQEVRVDLTFVSQMPAFVPGSDDDAALMSRQLGAAEWDARLLRVLRRHTLRSYVQAGEVHGSVAIGPRLLAFRGTGLRQHSWGVRDWGASDEATQCFASFTPTNGSGSASGTGMASGPGTASRSSGPGSASGSGMASVPTRTGSAARLGNAREGEAPVQVWLHSARFPWLTLAGGFVQRLAGVVALRDLGVRPTRQPGRAPSHVGFHVDAPGGDLGLEMATVAELGLDMDGRGHLDLALCRVQGAGDGWALVISQRRLLRRPGSPEE